MDSHREILSHVYEMRRPLEGALEQTDPLRMIQAHPYWSQTMSGVLVLRSDSGSALERVDEQLVLHVLYGGFALYEVVCTQVDQ